MTRKIKIINFLLFFLITILTNNLKAEEIALYTIEGNFIKTTNNGSLIISEGDSIAIDKFGKKIFSDQIIYNKKKLTIETQSNSIFVDEQGNKLHANNFLYNLKSKIISAKGSVKYFEKEGNVFYFDKLEYNENLKKGIGENFKAKLLDKSTINANFAEFNNIEKTLVLGKDYPKKKQHFLNLFNKNENYYSSCESVFKSDKKINEQCPDWSLSTQKTVYNRNEKMLYHYGTFLKIKNIPVFYTPYFSHPDPSVKRKSGILAPSIKNFTDLGQTLKTPYFWAIDDSSDLTITPVFYFDENNVYLAEYRKQNLNNKIFIDTSYSEGYKNLNKIDSSGNSIARTNGSRNHFFFNFLGNYDDLLLNKNDIEINLQRISQKNYLKVHEINTNQIKQDINLLNNNFILNSYEKNKKITFRTNILEDLNNENKNQKYQYTIPGIEYSDFFRKFNINLNLYNSLLGSNYGGDSNQLSLINKIDAQSDPKIFKNFIQGLTNTFKASINNINYYNENLADKKENLTQNIYLTTALESSYPLLKLGEKKEETIIPKTFLKFTTGKMDNANSEDKKLSYNDIYSMNRMNNLTNPETGASLGYGVEYNFSNKNENNEIYNKISTSIGQVLKPKKQNEMPNNSSLKDKSSNFVGNIFASYNNELTTNNKAEQNNFDINYDYILNKNFNKFLKNTILANYYNRQNKYSLDYHETNGIGNEHYIDLKYTRNFENFINFSAGTKKNLNANFTESNYFGINYDTDCLNIGINLSKQFYRNDELKPSNNLTLSVTFKPFGTPLSPDISELLK